MGEGPQQPGLDLLCGEPGIDHPPAIDRGDEPCNLDPLVGPDARRRDQGYVRTEGGGAGNAHAAAAGSAIPAGALGGGLKTSRKPGIAAEQRHPERQRLLALDPGKLVDEAFGEEGQLALRRSPHVPGAVGQIRRGRADPHMLKTVRDDHSVA